MRGPRYNPQPVRNDFADRQLFSHLHEVWCPENVFIFGAGPSVKPWLNWVQPQWNRALVALNSMIMVDIPWSHWVFFDTNSMNYSWAHSEPPENCCVLMGQKIATEKATFVYDASPRLTFNAPLQRGAILNNATVAGGACQIFHWAKPKDQELTIWLFGCDFRGGRHHDGTSAGRQGGVWWQTRYMNYLIHELRRRGTNIVSATPTALDVPVMDIKTVLR